MIVGDGIMDDEYKRMWYFDCARLEASLFVLCSEGVIDKTKYLQILASFSAIEGRIESYNHEFAPEIEKTFRLLTSAENFKKADPNWDLGKQSSEIN